MDSTNTNTVLAPNVFVPMNESQMASAKGGDDGWNSEAFQQMILDLIDSQLQDPDSVVSQILENFDELTTIDESIWDNIADDMESEGLAWPSAEFLYDSFFMGGDGGVP